MRAIEMVSCKNCKPGCRKKIEIKNNEYLHYIGNGQWNKVCKCGCIIPKPKMKLEMVK